MSLHPLMNLSNQNEPNELSGFAEFTSRLSIQELVHKYETDRQNAPRRQPRKQYFVATHNGTVSTGRKDSQQLEARLVIALRNKSEERGQHYQLPNAAPLRLLDYQVPLYVRQSDGLGELDLFGVISEHCPAVVELKVPAPNGSASRDTPLKALLQGLAYCAVVEANLDAFRSEVQARWGVQLQGEKPTLLVMAPRQYWEAYRVHPRAGRWESALGTLRDQIHQALSLPIALLSIETREWEAGLHTVHPQLQAEVVLKKVID